MIWPWFALWLAGCCVACFALGWGVRSMRYEIEDRRLEERR